MKLRENQNIFCCQIEIVNKSQIEQIKFFGRNQSRQDGLLYVTVLLALFFLKLSNKHFPIQKNIRNIRCIMNGKYSIGLVHL